MILREEVYVGAQLGAQTGHIGHPTVCQTVDEISYQNLQEGVSQPNPNIHIWLDLKSKVKSRSHQWGANCPPCLCFLWIWLNLTTYGDLAQRQHSVSLLPKMLSGRWRLSQQNQTYRVHTFAGCRSHQPHMLQSYNNSISRGMGVCIISYITQPTKCTISCYQSVCVLHGTRGLISYRLAR